MKFSVTSYYSLAQIYHSLSLSLQKIEMHIKIKWIVHKLSTRSVH